MRGRYHDVLIDKSERERESHRTPYPGGRNGSRRKKSDGVCRRTGIFYTGSEIAGTADQHKHRGSWEPLAKAGRRRGDDCGDGGERWNEETSAGHTEKQRGGEYGRRVNGSVPVRWWRKRQSCRPREPKREKERSDTNTLGSEESLFIHPHSLLTTPSIPQLPSPTPSISSPKRLSPQLLLYLALKRGSIQDKLKRKRGSWDDVGGANMTACGGGAMPGLGGTVRVLDGTKLQRRCAESEVTRVVQVSRDGAVVAKHLVGRWRGETRADYVGRRREREEFERCDPQTYSRGRNRRLIGAQGQGDDRRTGRWAERRKLEADMRAIVWRKRRWTQNECTADVRADGCDIYAKTAVPNVCEMNGESCRVLSRSR